MSCYLTLPTFILLALILETTEIFVMRTCCQQVGLYVSEIIISTSYTTPRRCYTVSILCIKRIMVDLGISPAPKQ